MRDVINLRKSSAKLQSKKKRYCLHLANSDYKETKRSKVIEAQDYAPPLQTQIKQNK